MLSTYSGKIKIFLDGADLDEMMNLSKNPLIKGLTTNPSLIKRAGIKSYREFCINVLENITHLPISLEVLADDFSEMERQARMISSWGPNVFVKIPITNSHGDSSIPLIKKLVQDKLKLNVTAILTIEQVIQSIDVLNNGPSAIISIFAGRIADTGRDPMLIVKEAVDICKFKSENIEILWASTRELFNIVQAESIGCDIITCTTDLLKKMPLINKDLNTLSLETVQMFKNDAEMAGYSL